LGIEPRKTSNSGAPTLSKEAEGHTGVSAIRREGVGTPRADARLRAVRDPTHAWTHRERKLGEPASVPTTSWDRIGKSKDARR